MFLPVKNLIATTKNLRFGVMVSSNQLISKRLQSGNLLLL